MKRIVVVHWNADEAKPYLTRLRRGGAYKVEHVDQENAHRIRRLRNAPPDAILIDLSRLPSQGRAVGVWLRQQKGTRNVPIVFVAGTESNVARARNELPDAVYTQWRTIRSAVRAAMKNAPTTTHVPGTMDAYSSTPLAKKLGIKAGQVLMLLGAPPDFAALLGDVRDEVRIKTRAAGDAHVVMLFAKSLRVFNRRLPIASKRMVSGGRLWVAWPKKSSGVNSDLSGKVVRKTGLDSGLVDYKICAIDATWSGLCFARRK